MYLRFGATTSRIRHLSKATLHLKGHKPPRRNIKSSSKVGEMPYEERFKALKSQCLEKRLRNDLVQAHKILYDQILLGSTIQILQKARTKKIIAKAVPHSGTCDASVF